MLSAIAPYVGRVRPDELARPTPCTSWNLAQLLAHMVGQHRGFAAAARGDHNAEQPHRWADATLGPDPAATYLAAAAEVSAAFGEEDLLDRTLSLYGYGTFSARTALHMHAVDYMAHGWDVARSIGLSGALHDELAEYGLHIARGWPDTPKTYGTDDSAPFREHVPVEDGAPAYQRLVAYLGRDPMWSPPMT